MEFDVRDERPKKTAEEKIRQMKTQAIKDLKNSSVDIAIHALEKIIKKSNEEQTVAKPSA